jgi:hypothetical protein
MVIITNFECVMASNRVGLPEAKWQDKKEQQQFSSKNPLRPKNRLDQSNGSISSELIQLLAYIKSSTPAN